MDSTACYRELYDVATKYGFVDDHAKELLELVVQSIEGHEGA